MEALIGLFLDGVLEVELAVCSVVSEGLGVLAFAVEGEDFNLPAFWAASLTLYEALPTEAGIFCTGLPAECGCMDEKADVLGLAGEDLVPLAGVFTTDNPPTKAIFTGVTVDDFSSAGADFSLFTGVFSVEIASWLCGLLCKADEVAALTGDAFLLATESFSFSSGLGDFTFIADVFGDDEVADCLEDFS